MWMRLDQWTSSSWHLVDPIDPTALCNNVTGIASDRLDPRNGEWPSEHRQCPECVAILKEGIYEGKR
jgi:hypothetical protein